MPGTLLNVLHRLFFLSYDVDTIFVAILQMSRVELETKLKQDDSTALMLHNFVILAV